MEQRKTKKAAAPDLPQWNSKFRYSAQKPDAAKQGAQKEDKDSKGATIKASASSSC